MNSAEPPNERGPKARFPFATCGPQELSNSQPAGAVPCSKSPLLINTQFGSDGSGVSVAVGVMVGASALVSAVTSIVASMVASAVTSAGGVGSMVASAVGASVGMAVAVLVSVGGTGVGTIISVGDGGVMWRLPSRWPLAWGLWRFRLRRCFLRQCEAGQRDKQQT